MKTGLFAVLISQKWKDQTAGPVFSSLGLVQLRSFSSLETGPSNTNKNYVLFHQGFCDSKVLIVIVVTGCEDMEPMMDMYVVDQQPPVISIGQNVIHRSCLHVHV